MKVLIVEDRQELADNVAQYLSSQDYLCEQATSRRDALMMVSLYDYDCILLDLMLPDGSGMDVLRWLKLHKPSVGVIVVSARNSTEDIVEGLKIGADDYISKPFNLTELSMRSFALIRRRSFQASNVLSEGKLTIYLEEKKVTVGQQELDLTKSEYELLLFLISNKNKVVSKSAIAEHLSGEMVELMSNFNFVFAHIKNLKKKLAAADYADHIRTLYGVGYKWVD